VCSENVYFDETIKQYKINDTLKYDDIKVFDELFKDNKTNQTNVAGGNIPQYQSDTKKSYKQKYIKYNTKNRKHIEKS
jgi:hypothetical protein